MRFVVVVGSHRSNSQSGKVARYLGTQISELVPRGSTFHLDLGRTSLPMWRESDDAQKDNFESIWPQISDELLVCDALVVVAPEWHGMVPPALKNFFLHCDGELANKPGLIVGVSAGNGGAYPISELRMSSYKNSRICWIPDHLVVRNVEDVLNDSSGPTTASEDKLRQRAMYCIRLLAEYAKGLTLVRSSGVVDLVAHPFGM